MGRVVAGARPATALAAVVDSTGMAHVVTRSLLLIDEVATAHRRPEQLQLAALVRAEGYEVTLASGCFEAIEIAESRSFGLIFLELAEPTEIGLGILYALRGLPAHTSTPIVVLATARAGANAEDGRLAGATAWLGKPFRPETLLRGLAQLTGAWAAFAPLALAANEPGPITGEPAH